MIVFHVEFVWFAPDLFLNLNNKLNWKYFQRDRRASVEGWTTCQALLGGWRAGDDHDHDGGDDDDDDDDHDDFGDAIGNWS